MKVVKKAYKNLNKNGLLFVYVPNWQSASSTFRRGKFTLFGAHHLFLPKTLQKFLSRQNLKQFLGNPRLDIYDKLVFNHKNNSKFYVSNLDKIQFMFNSTGYGKNLRMLAIKE